MVSTPSILAFSGSTRRESLNTRFLRAAVGAVEQAGGKVTLLNLADYPLPLYQGDLEDREGLPPQARALVDLVHAHDALLIASPEYNTMPTPLLKNTIDWCTRADDDPFPGKVVAVISASPGGLGGIRSLKATQQLLLHLGAHIVPGNTMLPKAHEAFTEAGELKDERAKKSLATLAQALVETARKLRA